MGAGRDPAHRLGRRGRTARVLRRAAWSRWRFVRLASDEKATTTLGLLAECFEALGGVPKVVLADRMGCLKGGGVADVVVPTADYVRFAAHYGFRPDFCQAADPQSKGMVEHLVGYAKRDLLVPASLDGALAVTAANEAARSWCTEVNAVQHSEICAVPAERLESERSLLSDLPSLRPRLDRATLGKVDKLSCVRFGSARYSVPTRLMGQQVELLTGGRCASSSRSPASSSPTIRWSRRARPASSTSTTARRDRTGRAEPLGPKPSWRSSSWHSDRSRTCS